MPARVAEHPRSAVTVAHREQRDTEHDPFDVITVVRDRRRRDEHARRRPQQSELLGEPLRIDVVLDRFTPCLAFIGRARVEVGEDPVDDLDIARQRRIRAGAHRSEYHEMVVTCQDSSDYESEI